MSYDEKEREKERELRDRIFESPSLLPGFNEPAAAAADEVPVRRPGKADLVFVDAEGQIAIVECKRASNPECRRKVIGQVFEYAAGLWKCDYEDFRRLLRVRGKVDEARWDEETFRDAVSRNLEVGDFRLFIAVDEMTPALKKKLDRTVTLLNSRLPKEVQFVAVEWPPRGPVETYGEDPEAIEPLTPKLDPDRLTLIDGISSPDAALAAEGLLDWAEGKQRVTVSYTRSKKDGIETGVIEVPDRGTLFRIKEQREVRVSFRALRQHWDEERINRLVQDLAKIDARFQIDTKYKGMRPEAPIESLAEAGKRDEFLALMEGVRKTLAG